MFINQLLRHFTCIVSAVHCTHPIDISNGNQDDQHPTDNYLYNFKVRIPIYI